MDKVINDFKAKNFDLEIESDLHAVNRGLDFAGFLDADQALGAVMLIEALNDLDRLGCDEWTIYGWYPQKRFGDDHGGRMNDVSFLNEAYFTNEEMMDELWYKMPCLSIMKPKGMSMVWIGVDDAPYLRHTIMEHRMVKKITIRNDSSSLFPGEDAFIEVCDERYKTDDGYPIWLKFRMPEAYCIRYNIDDKWMHRWYYTTPDKHNEMFAKLNKMSHEYWEERE